jgi:hypothetical protein
MAAQKLPDKFVVDKLQFPKYCHTDDSVNAVVAYLITQLFYALSSFLANSLLAPTRYYMHLVGYQLIYGSSSQKNNC